MYNESRRADLPLLLLTAAACGIGLTLAASMGYIGAAQDITSGETGGLFVTQAAALLIGAVLCITLMLTGSRRLARYGTQILIAGMALTALTFTSLGVSPEGSDDRAWLSLGGVTLQPSEMLKLCFIISFAAHISSVQDRLGKPRELMLLLLHAAAPTALVWAQGDQGTALVFILIAAGMLFAAGLGAGYFAAAVFLFPLAGWVLWSRLLGEHQRDRIRVLLDPSADPLGTGFQQLQAGRALSQGGLWGSGLFSRERDLIYVSQAENDFIFSYAGQVGGLVLCGAIIAVLFAAVIRMTVLAGRSTGAGRLMTAGAAMMLFSHTFLNLAMVLGFMPVIGIPLPLISAGGTAMIAMLGAVGIACGS